MFMASLISIVNASNHTNCVWLSNQKCMISTTLTNLHPNDYSQEFHYFSFAVMLDRFAGSYDTLNELSNKVCFPNKTEDLNLSVLIMTTGVYESKTLTKPLLRECKCRFDEIKCNSDPWWNNNKFWCEYKKCHACEKDYVWNSATCNCENGKNLASIMDDSAISCDEIIESYDKEANIILTNFNEKKATCKTQISIFCLHFY